MGLREMFALVRELHPEMERGEITLTFTSAMNGALEFKCGLAEKPVRVPVAWSTTPEQSFAQQAAKHSRYRADCARAEATRAAEHASKLADNAAKLEARAAELEALVPAPTTKGAT